MPRRKDRFSKAKRSFIMSRIRGKKTGLDLAMRKLLRRAGIKFKMYPRIVGNPDFLVGQRIAVFCDSSFWHGRNWKKLKAQLERGSNASYWVAHIAGNRRRDRQINAKLRKTGYDVLRLWDEEVFEHPADCAMRIKKALAAESKRRGAHEENTP